MPKAWLKTRGCFWIRWQQSLTFLLWRNGIDFLIPPWLEWCFVLTNSSRWKRCRVCPKRVCFLPAALGTLHIEIQPSFYEKPELAGELPSTDRERATAGPKATVKGHRDEPHSTLLVHSLEEFPANSPVSRAGPAAPWICSSPWLPADCSSVHATENRGSTQTRSDQLQHQGPWWMATVGVRFEVHYTAIETKTEGLTCINLLTGVYNFCDYSGSFLFSSPCYATMPTLFPLHLKAFFHKAFDYGFLISNAFFKLCLFRFKNIHWISCLPLSVVK